MINHGKLMDRYPAIGFQLSLTSGRSWKPKPLPKINLNGIEVLYLNSIAYTAYYENFKSWLNEAPQRALIFLEENLNAIRVFLEQENASLIIEDKQVHIHLVSNWEESLETLALQFPNDRIEVIAPKKYATQLKRNTVAFHALISEAVYAHKLCKNLLPNFKRLSSAFYANGLKDQFKGVPAIICGAGPSLQDSIPFLKTVGNKALIIAGGSGIPAVSRQGVLPHFTMALDPNPEEYTRLERSMASDVPFLYANRLYPDVFKTIKGPIGYLRSDTGGTLESWLEKQLGLEDVPIGPNLGREAFSVTTLAVAFAVHLGCNPIFLCGVDLAYTDGKRYAEGVLAEEEVIKEKGVLTHLKWEMESKALSDFAKNHPKISFFNASRGLGFSHISYKKLEDFNFAKSFDLRDQIQSAIQNLKMSHINVEPHLQLLKKSLIRTQELVHEKNILKEIEFREEIIYEALFHNMEVGIELALQHLPEEKREELKWKQFKEVIDTLLTCFEECGY